MIVAKMRSFMKIFRRLMAQKREALLEIKGQEAY